MPALLTHLTAVERLAAHVNTLPAEFVRALGEDLEYARFGAALPELPWFGRPGLGLGAWLGRGDPPHYAQMMTSKAPVGFGFKAAELVSNGALVGVEAGLAFVAGYFTQLCVSRALEPVVQSLLMANAHQGESPRRARSRIEWIQSLFLMQELHGSPLVGTPGIRSKLQIRKGSALKGIGGGLYELMRVSCHEALGEAPSQWEVDTWVRGLSVFSLALGSPLGRLGALPTIQAASQVLYRAPGVDVFGAVDRGLEHTREVLSLVGSMILKHRFTPRARHKLLEVCPEGPPEIVLKPRAA